MITERMQGKNETYSLEILVDPIVLAGILGVNEVWNQHWNMNEIRFGGMALLQPSFPQLFPL